jgi:nanoRNase/pAp phosphatase (c-di-AMP/oligoRNAs hydrolase)
MRVRVLHHDHCFDGAASAAYFTRFAREKFYPHAEFLYTGMMHTAAQSFPEELFDGDENAIVDFKYASSERLTWWFDHHQSAFLSPADAAHFGSREWPHKFFDPKYKSCTKFIADIARKKFGFEAPDLADLVRWADIIDGAQYADAREATELKSPATQLVLVIEAAKGPDTVKKIIRMMTERPLAAIASDAEIRAEFEPLYEAHRASMDVIRERARLVGNVVFFDLSELNMEGYNKFVPYYLFPQAVYTVSVLNASFRTKISIGSNPWAPSEPAHNLASLCERYGGGGHPRVGAISLKKGEIAEARRIATEVLEELNR